MKVQSIAGGYLEFTNLTAWLQPLK